MKILVIGGGGMLGHKLVQKWRGRYDVWTTIRGSFQEYERYGIFEKEKTFENIEVENFSAVESVTAEVRPQVIVNAVGIIKQLPTAKNVIKTLQINAIFPHQLAELAEKYEARLITVGTDCVFDGKKGNYTEEDFPSATDLYGKSKNLGEVTGANCLTLRTSIIGRELKTAHSLVEWFLSNEGKEGKTVKGFTNAIYTGFPTVIFAEILARLIEDFPDLNGLYQVSSEPINKFELLKLIRDAYRADIEIEPFDDFKIDRSLDSSKFKAATNFEFPDWRTMIRKMAEDNAVYQK
ncbi:MAG: SDR family oxidoreductase [Pyrinomonadaceae bacterium]|nr:SDR family oxidoreductase [Pyrinomonadaceae bacterium]